MKVLITGSNGMLAQDLIPQLEEENWQTDAFTKNELDITQPKLIETRLLEIGPEVVINCAAYTQVDQAEIDAANAKRVNRDGVRYLARLCARYQIKLVHISTDFVFDGKQSEPYTESDTPNPTGVYGQSKLAGEKVILTESIDALIVRTSWLYGAEGHNFVKTMLRLARERSEIKVVDDQIGSPTWTVDFAQALVRLLKARASGIIHFSNRGQCSWYEFASNTIQIAYQQGYLSQQPSLVPIPTSQYPTPAQRPAFSVLNCEKYSKLTQQLPPHWQKSLAQMITQLSENSR